MRVLVPILALRRNVKIAVIPGRRAAVNPEPRNTGLWDMGSGFAASGRAPE